MTSECRTLGLELGRDGIGPSLHLLEGGSLGPKLLLEPFEPLGHEEDDHTGVGTCIWPGPLRLRVLGLGISRLAMTVLTALLHVSSPVDSIAKDRQEDGE